jgi:3-hydroxyisobutyrate dehydrogenase-like beta-hydroxyacid dehydrogenase
MTSIGLIGAGEAGSAIAAGLRDEFGVVVHGFDARGTDPLVRERADSAGLRLLADVGDLVRASDVVLCLTSAKVAVSCAEQAAPFLRAGQIYSDWNSASPQLKRDVAAVIARTPSGFADGAVMAAVPPHRHRVPVLVSGSGARDLADALAGFSMRLEVLDGEAGQASAVKMFRSLLVKGLEALLLECAMGAHEYGATSRVLTSMNGSLPTEDWNELADYLLRRSIEHGVRRAEELRQAAATLDEIGIEPLLARAGSERLQRFAECPTPRELMDLPYDDVLSHVAKAARA